MTSKPTPHPDTEMWLETYRQISTGVFEHLLKANGLVEITLDPTVRYQFTENAKWAATTLTAALMSAK